MCWDKEPSSGSCAGEPVVSRELLRKVCEPFFEQMLDALQHALEQQQKQKYEDYMQSVRAMAQCQPSLPLYQLDPMPDDETTDIDEFGAFASLLSGPSSEDEISNIAFANPHEITSIPESLPQNLAPTYLLKEESDQSSDAEKSVMVCRHWKSKGWCRLESKCKFQHPEHKRGVAVPNSNTKANGGDITGLEHPGRRTTLSLRDALCKEGQTPAAMVGQLKKRSKGKSARGHKEEPKDLGKEAAVSIFFSEYDTSCVPCISTVQFFAGPGAILE